MDPVKAKANYSRVCQLLIDKGGIALRAALHVVHPPSSLPAVLNANKSTLLKIRYSIIKAPQWNLLFPASGTPDSNNFDITLLTILLRNICGLPSPTTGWNVMPPASDTSISADILRIKMLRNEIYGHIAQAEYDDTTFEKYWQEISIPLTKLGIPQKDIDELKLGPLSLEEKSYIESLKEWKEQEDELLSKLADVERELLNLRRDIKSVGISQIEQLAKFDFSLKINDLSKKFQDGTRQWFFDRLSSWLCDKESRVMILTAGPGIGKSVLLAKICEMYKQCGLLAACHFCDFKKSDYSNPQRILQSLASQMCENVDEFRDKLNEVFRREHSRESLSDAFRVLLEDPLHGLDRTEPMLIVIDALDESKTEVKCEFLELIADEFEKLPKWIKILISSRPELQVRKKLEFLNPFEILPDDSYHLNDLEHFIQSSLTNVSEDDLCSLISKCEGSFLYAYYQVTELKQGGKGFEPKSRDYISKSIGGFYHKQFTRLKTGLQRCKPDAWSSILKSFKNAIAASREPLPVKIVFTCMGLSSEEYDVREMIIGIMSEILPIYDNCLTIYHKSLWDWLTLNGYEEHAFVGNIKDGKECLWRACENIYRDIVSLRSISDFEISPERSYALMSGGKYLLDVGDAKDFHWLVNVRLNYLKLKLDKNLDVPSIRRFCKSKHLDNLWEMPHMNAFSVMVLLETMVHYHMEQIRGRHYLYLQSLANGYFDFVQKAMSGKNEARDILNKTNEVWVEELEDEYIPNNTIISHTIIGKDPLFIDAMAVSPDKRLLAYKEGVRVEVFNLPNLTMMFSLEIKNGGRKSKSLIFSPNSLYLLWNSVRSCISISKQKEVPFIPLGPESVDCVSFSSCGMKLVTSEAQGIKVWDLKKRKILAEIKADFHVEYCFFSNCKAYICSVEETETFDLYSIVIWNSKTIARLNKKEMICSERCFAKKRDYQIISPPPQRNGKHFSRNLKFEVRHFHCPTDGIVLISNKYCSNPFSWNDRQCVMSFNPDPCSLEIYDFINQEVVDVFHVDCLPAPYFVHCISKLDETNFLVGLTDQAFVFSFETSTQPFKSDTEFFSNLNIKCCTLSPDNSYIACCSVDRFLKIINVDDAKTLQTVKLKHRPEACWWSDFYLWVICNSVVVKYSYDSKQMKVLGNETEECFISFERVLLFEEGALVIQPSENSGISILKICSKQLYPQQIPDSNFTVSSASVSSDGCAVLLYHELSYQLWEIVGEHRWELRSSGDMSRNVAWCCLTGTKDFLSSIWLTNKAKRFRFPPFSNTTIELSDFKLNHVYGPVWLSSVEHVTGKQFVTKLPLIRRFDNVFCVNSKFIIVHQDTWIYVIRVATGEIVTSLYVGDHVFLVLALPGFRLFGWERNVHKIFRIRNIENLLDN